MNKNFSSFLKQNSWIIPLPIAVIFSFLFLKHNPFVLGIGTLIFYLIGLLFVYRKARWLIFFLISFTPMLVTSFLFKKELAHHLYGQILFWFVFIICLGLGYWLARKWEIIPKPSLKMFPIGKISIGFLLLFAASFLSGIIGQLTHSSVTENQAAINTLATAIPTSIFVAQTLSAGFFEELAFRAGVFEIIFKKNKILAFITACFIFALLHSPSDLYSWFTYGSMSLVLTGLYAKYRNFYLNMAVHLLWNFLGVLVIILYR